MIFNIAEKTVRVALGARQKGYFGRVRFQRGAVALTEGSYAYGPFVSIDRIQANTKLADLCVQEQAIQGDPIETIKRTIELVRSNLRYPYPSLLNSASPAEVAWVNGSILTHDRPPRMTDIVEMGFGSCREFTALAALLLSLRNLEVILSGGAAINAEIKELGLPHPLMEGPRDKLFLTDALGTMSAHAWLEAKIDNGFVPVDPLIGLIGTKPGHMDIFDKYYLQEQYANKEWTVGFQPDLTCLGIRSYLSIFPPASRTTEDLGSVIERGYKIKRIEHGARSMDCWLVAENISDSGFDQEVKFILKRENTSILPNAVPVGGSYRTPIEIKLF
ncbi:MAG: hypothetical protein PHG97_02990 [Candidatus Margulisbacteria bacterium]|nr:hypothetical protein [Candidatus Margulisiibacteriota bacterium]